MTPSEKPPIDDLAPTPIEDVMFSEDGGDETGGDTEDGSGQGEGGGKKTGGGGGKKPKTEAKLVERDFSGENLQEYNSESLIEKLKMLVWAPFSTMVPGASAFESEQDLKRKLFLGQLGLMTNQIDPEDIADPKLIERLEQRNQMRQEQVRIEIAQAGSAAGMGGAVAAMQEVPQNQQKAQQKKQDVKLQAQQPKEASLDASVEAQDKKPDGGQKIQTPVKTDTKTEIAPEAEENSFAAEKDREDLTRPVQKEEGLSLAEIAHLMETGKAAEPPAVTAEASPLDPRGGLESMAMITELFNAFARQTEYSAPEQRTDFKFADPAPKVDASPMGNV